MMDGPTHVANKTFDKQSSVFNNMKHCEEKGTGKEINLFFIDLGKQWNRYEKNKYASNEIIIIGDFNYSK